MYFTSPSPLERAEQQDRVDVERPDAPLASPLRRPLITHRRNELHIARVTYQGDAKKLRARLVEQGWRVEKRKEYWLLYPPDKLMSPARMPGTPSSQRTWRNLLAALRRRGYKE